MYVCFPFLWTSTTFKRLLRGLQQKRRIFPFPGQYFLLNETNSPFRRLVVGSQLAYKETSPRSSAMMKNRALTIGSVFLSFLERCPLSFFCWNDRTPNRISVGPRLLISTRSSDQRSVVALKSVLFFYRFQLPACQPSGYSHDSLFKGTAVIIVTSRRDPLEIKRLKSCA